MTWEATSCVTWLKERPATRDVTSTSICGVDVNVSDQCENGWRENASWTRPIRRLTACVCKSPSHTTNSSNSSNNSNNSNNNNNNNKCKRNAEEFQNPLALQMRMNMQMRSDRFPLTCVNEASDMQMRNPKSKLKYRSISNSIHLIHSFSINNTDQFQFQFQIQFI